jgi:RimJ/RimL family protein N-acetyltransferase
MENIVIRDKVLPIVGTGVMLRKPRLKDFSETMVAWINDKEVTEYMSRGIIPADIKLLQKEFRSLKGHSSEIQFAIDDKSTKQYIGIVGLHSINWRSQHAEFRILIGEKSFWGQGKGSEVAKLLLAYAFESLKLHKVWLGVNSANKRAYESYLKVGFKAEGVLRDELFKNNKFYDVVRMSVLSQEYASTKIHKSA